MIDAAGVSMLLKTFERSSAPLYSRIDRKPVVITAISAITARRYWLFVT
jgi:hypothetical protein